MGSQTRGPRVLMGCWLEFATEPRPVVGYNCAVRFIQKVVPRKSEGDDDHAWKYWVTRPVAERLAMVEELRAEYHGWTNEPEPRLSRVCRIIRRP